MNKKLAWIRVILTPALVTGFLVLVSVKGSGVFAASAQQATPTDPVTIVENYLLARDSGDVWSAAGWCAELLELQDVDGSWFVDAATTSDWLRQLTGRYMIDRLSPLVAEGNVVSWTERLTRRGPFSGTAPHSIVIDVHAVIRADRIAYLSGPYPPIPLRSPVGAAGAPQPRAAAESSAPTSRPIGGGTTNGSNHAESSISNATVAPGTLFVGSAVGLALAVVLTARGGRALVGVLQRRRRGSKSPIDHCSGGAGQPLRVPHALVLAVLLGSLTRLLLDHATQV